MKIDSIIKLVEAGYTKDEIFKLESLEEPAPEETAAPSEEAAKEETAAPNQDVFNSLNNAIQNIESKIKELDSTIKKSNILKDSSNPEPVETAEDVLAKLLNAPTKGGS